MYFIPNRSFDGYDIVADIDRRRPGGSMVAERITNFQKKFAETGDLCSVYKILLVFNHYAS